jgi:putative RNA 2'-phosphotransferase
MDEKKIRSTSKLLSLVLRHRPEAIGLELDENGWANVAELLTKAMVNEELISKELLEIVVATNDKKRFAFNEDHSLIRASQGHSVDIDLAISPAIPPAVLLHGTVAEFIAAIQQSGLQKMKRQHVHLSSDEETAKKVGGRRGKPIILQVKAKEMHEAGFIFYCSDNGVWLTHHVSPEFIIFPA